MDISEFTQQYGLSAAFTYSAQHWFIPLAERIRSLQHGAKRPFFVAINGAQGSGKSTLCEFLAWYFRTAYGAGVATLSLDDVYLSQSAREQCAARIHPLLRVRGVPGTHDIPLLTTSLNALAEGKTLRLPRFSKAFDNPLPSLSWPLIDFKADLVIMEGWCWGVPPQTLSDLQHPINALEQYQDSDGRWRNYVNQQLQAQYLPLYRYFDYWVMLQAPSFDIVAQWRLEQEQRLAQQQPSAPFLMNPQQVEAFVQYFERLTRHCLATLPSRCDSVFRLADTRDIIELIQRPRE